MSERLKEKLANPAVQEADLTPSPPKNFETDCSEALRRAQITIEADIRTFTDANRKRLSEVLATTEAELTRLRQMVQPFALTMSAIAFLVIALSLTASWFWASAMIDHARQASLWQMGLQVNQTQNGSVLTWDESRLHLITCQSGKTKTPCLQITQGD